MFGKALPEPHDQADSSPSEVHGLVIESGDLSLLGAVSRLWDGDYVRIRGYHREISHWCSQNFFTTLNIKPNLNHWLLKDEKRKFIYEAESIVKSQKSQSEKANTLVILEAVRSLLKSSSPIQYGILGARLDQLIR